MKAGIGLAMLATRALIDRGGLDDCTHRDAVDHRRRDRQHDVAGADRGGSRRRAMRCWSSSRRCRRRAQDQPQGRRAVRDDCARRVRARRTRSRQGRQRRFASWRGRSSHRRFAGSRERRDADRRRRSGGTRANVVPAEARATIDARAITRADAERVQRAMRSLPPQIPGATLEVTGGFDRPPLERTAGVVRLFKLAQERRGGDRHRAGGGQRRRRIRRQLHRGAGRADARWIWRDRRRRARDSRARRDRRAGAARRDDRADPRSPGPPKRLRSGT